MFMSKNRSSTGSQACPFPAPVALRVEGRQPVQGFSLASAIGHSPKIVPDVREFAVQFGQFVRDDFQKCILYGNAQ